DGDLLDPRRQQPEIVRPVGFRRAHRRLRHGIRLCRSRRGNLRPDCGQRIRFYKTGTAPSLIHIKYASIDDWFICTQRDSTMRTTINLDDRLVEEAQRITGLNERTALVHEGLRALIERESARRLARLGGSEPNLKPIPRRRPDPA